MKLSFDLYCQFFAIASRSNQPRVTEKFQSLLFTDTNVFNTRHESTAFMGVSVDRNDPHGNFSGNPNIVIRTSHAINAVPVKGQIWEVLGSVVRDTFQVGGFNKIRFTF